MSNERLNFTAQKGGQWAFLSCPCFEVMLSGPRGSAKTLSMLMSFAQYVGQGFGPAWRGVILRHTMGESRDMVAESKRWFRRIFPGAAFNAVNKTWTFPEGEMLHFGYLRTLDDFEQYLGWSLPFVAFEELTKWSNPSVYLKMHSICRSSHPDIPRMIRSTTNPLGVGFAWVKDRFVNQGPAMTPIEDNYGNVRCWINSTLEENEALLESDPNYLNRLKGSIHDRNTFKAWVQGSWNIISGGFFSDVWRPDIHILQPFAIPAGWRIVSRGFDWGSSKPSCCLWYAVADGTAAKMHDGTWRNFPKGTIFVLKELYTCGDRPNEGLRMLPAKVARLILPMDENIEQVVYKGNLTKYANNPHQEMHRTTAKISVQHAVADSSMWDGSAGVSIAKQFEREGVKFKPCQKGPGSRIAGWQIVKQMLYNSTEVPPEGPGLYVFNCCKHTIRTLPSLPADSKNPADVDTNAEDHAADALRYIVTGQYDRYRTRSQEV